MTRAEEAALNAYPIKVEWVGNQYGGPADINKLSREKYQQGYEQAEKDIMWKVIPWLMKYAKNYIYNCTESYPGAPFKAEIAGKCWKDLKKYLEK